MTVKCRNILTLKQLLSIWIFLKCDFKAECFSIILQWLDPSENILIYDLLLKNIFIIIWKQPSRIVSGFFDE